MTKNILLKKSHSKWQQMDVGLGWMSLEWISLMYQVKMEHSGKKKNVNWGKQEVIKNKTKQLNWYVCMIDFQKEDECSRREVLYMGQINS